MTNEQVASAMQLRGGRFVQCLADAWFAADPINRARIEQAFADLFERYRKAAA